MSQGKAMNRIPLDAELTTQEAANVLYVSLPYLINLLESGEIPFRQIGRHRRILFQDVIKYKEDIDRKRMETLDELVAQAQELNMGY